MPIKKDLKVFFYYLPVFLITVGDVPSIPGSPAGACIGLAFAVGTGAVAVDAIGKPCAFTGAGPDT